MYEQLIRPILFALSIGDAERAHILTLRALAVLQEVPLLLRTVEHFYEARKNPEPVEVAGIKFPNRVGLAAGLDKDGRILSILQALGFGFIEIGSVLPRPQPGNPRPRLFRLPKHGALINRMGFNSDGARTVERRLSREMSKGRLHVPLGISLGKMKDTPLEKATEDYIEVHSRLRKYASYLVVNVSSPNTPELRDLQKPEVLELLIYRITSAEQVMARSSGREVKPIFVKIAPDFENTDFDEVVKAAILGGARGLVITNTTTQRPIPHPQPRVAQEEGGFSGPQTLPRTVELVARARAIDARIPIIGVGGITNVEAMKRVRDAGADLIQVYTGFIYQGPQLVTRLRAVQ